MQGRLCPTPKSMVGGVAMRSMGPREITGLIVGFVVAIVAEFFIVPATNWWLASVVTIAIVVIGARLGRYCDDPESPRGHIT